MRAGAIQVAPAINYVNNGSAQTPSSEPHTAKPLDPESRRYARKLAAIFILVAAMLALAGYIYLARRQAEARAAAHQQLSAIADLKLRQISNWREERLSDAGFFSRARFVAQEVRRFLDNPEADAARSAVLDWLELLKSGGRYDAAMIFDARLERRLTIPDWAREPVASVRGYLETALRTHGVVMSDLHQDQPNDLVHLDVLFPIFEHADPQPGTPIAVVLLRLDAREFLFPLIQSWPTPSPTAETLLVRREGNQVLYLNDLRHRSGTALALRLPLTSPELTAAKVLRGETRVIEGLDYRGVPVVAVGRQVPGTPWAMVAKVDREELYAPLRQQMFGVVAVLGTLLVASAFLVALLWRQRSDQFLRGQLALEQERAALAERLAHLMRYANDIILLFDPEGRILEANEYALRHYGYSLPEIQEKHLRDLCAPESVSRLERDFQQLETEGAIAFETVHQRKDGSPFPVEASSRKIRVGGETFILSIIRDITQRQAHEREIERLNRLYAALSQVNQAIVRAGSRQDLMQEVCRVLVRFGGFQMAWIGWMDETTAQIVPVAQCGDEAGHLQAIQVFAGDEPEGRCPIGTAIRESRPCVCNNLDRDSQSRIWAEAAARSGWRSLAAFPVRQEGRTCGALAVYSRQSGFFGGQEQVLLEEAATDVSFGLDTLLTAQRRKEAEESLRALNAELEQRVRQRTADLEAKNKSLEAFTYSVSHDLKSPLRTISGFSDMLVETAAARLDPTERQLLEKITQAAGRMNRLINDLLAYSRLELQAITWSVVDLRGLIQAILEEYQPEIIRHKTTVNAAVECAPVTADAAGLTQALRNVIGNAIKFSAQAAQPAVDISARDSEADCLLTVRDNGIGFDMQYREKIFELFQRLHGAEVYSGTGIGLAIVRRAMTRIGGRVWAESEPGKGAAFFLQIPRKAGAMD